MTDIDLEPIKARLEAATDGPWEIDPTAHDWAAGVRCLPCQVSVADTASVEIAEFIAHAPTDIDALVAEVERLRALLTAEPTEDEVEVAWQELRRHRLGSSPRPDLTQACDCGAIEPATGEGWMRLARHGIRAALRAARNDR